MIPEFLGGINGPRFYKTSNDGLTITAESVAEDQYLHTQFFKRQGGGGVNLIKSYTTNPNTGQPLWVEVTSDDPNLIQDLAKGLNHPTDR